ncbi:hypothetical protein HOK51_09860 [Candidatus Woesearchaeota archaeon]|nr:hypothetical protein [Candidatus Woesearchaeota archaeon]MBT6520129.1 hypothetical protein [Candidatus Woesearchaeota archaeon]MBT7366734.1 hypothetical protein [Candidatus Woesearchaeota archaeon]
MFNIVDIRKIIIIFLIAVLFSVLVFSTIEAFYPNPEWDNYCREKGFPKVAPLVQNQEVCQEIDVNDVDQNACESKKGYIEFNYDSKGCPTSYECNTCSKEYDFARQTHDQYVFYISALLALVAIFIGLYLPAQTNNLNEWIGTGFMLGGTFALFFGTASTFGSLDRIIRPIIIFLELVLVIFIAYKKIGNLRMDDVPITKKVLRKRKKK